MRKTIISLALLTVGLVAFGYEVSTDRNIVEKTGDVSVDVRLDSPMGLSFINVRLAYDVSVLSVKSVHEGTLSPVFGDTFVSVVTNGIVSISLFSESGENVASNQAGTVATILFAVRSGVADVRTDIPIIDVELGEQTGVIDVTVVKALSVFNPVSSLVAAEVVASESWEPGGIPESWAIDYPAFREKFGDDFSQAIYKKTGKKNAKGEDLLVWHDFVQGTDPTDCESKFTARVEMVDGKPVITWDPALNDTASEKGVKTGRRTYRTYGKKTLGDEKWIEIKDGEESVYRFFKVTVEMP